MAPPELLYTFSLPPNLINDFQARQLSLPKTIIETPVIPPLPTSLGSTGLFHCNITGANFVDLNSLRLHYKTDWYKYNVKLRLKGINQPVTEEAFDQLVEGLSNSISGSDSSASSTSSVESKSSSTNAVSRLLRKQQSKPIAPTSDDFEGELTGPRSALLWFEAPNSSPGTQFGIYRAALPLAGQAKQKSTGIETVNELKGLQLPEILSSKAIKGKLARGEEVIETKERKWTLLMFGGGHFAGMVVSLVPKLVSKGKGKEKEMEVVIIEKKTFHRYTTRRKQGGSQAANDNAKGKASSAGASLRRANETALIEEVRDLLGKWKEEVQSSELIFLRASKTNYKTFFGYEGAVMDKKDPRIRGFSFPTRRPTLSELTAAFLELTRVKVSHLSASALAELDAAYIASVTPAPLPIAPAPKVVPPKPVVKKLSAAEELFRDLWERLLDMVKKGKIEAIEPFLIKYESILSEDWKINWGTLPNFREERFTLPTLLHVASISDQPEMVRWLILEKGANPTLAASSLAISELNPISNKPIQTPYELATTKQTRNSFRLLATEKPELWDWIGSGPLGARIPSALNIAKEEERERKLKAHQDRLREKQLLRESETLERNRLKKVEEDRLIQEKEAREQLELLKRGGSNLNKTGPQRLGGGPSARIVKAQGGGSGSGLNEQDQMRVDRERRARAAEARFAKPA